MGTKPTLLVDLSAGVNQHAGIGRYARMIAQAMLPYLPDIQIHGWYAPESAHPPYASDIGAWHETWDAFSVRRGRVSRKRADQIWFRSPIRLPARLLTGAADAVYSPDFTAPPLNAPSIITIHDLAFAKAPELSPPQLVRYLRQAVPRAIADSEIVATVSESTKADVCEHFDLHLDRVLVARCGVEDRFSSAPALTSGQRAALGLPADYVLAVGTLEPRKNHANLLRAISLTYGQTGVPLVIAGAPGWESEKLLPLIDSASQRGEVIWLEQVADEMLPAIYASAAASVYVSRFEGFGLPVLEGLASGKPVVTSDIPTSVEVSGDLAILVNPTSPDSIADGILRALATESRSAEATDSRRARAATFQWSDSGKIIADCVKQLQHLP